MVATSLLMQAITEVSKIMAYLDYLGCPFDFHESLSSMLASARLVLLLRNIFKVQDDGDDDDEAAAAAVAR
jgi:hypothetical protein